jgi:hypothetical protein
MLNIGFDRLARWPRSRAHSITPSCRARRARVPCREPVGCDHLTCWPVPAWPRWAGQVSLPRTRPGSVSLLHVTRAAMTRTELPLASSCRAVPCNTRPGLASPASCGLATLPRARTRERLPPCLGQGYVSYDAGRHGARPTSHSTFCTRP